MDKQERKNLRTFGVGLGLILLILGIRLFFIADSRNWIYFVTAGSAFGLMGFCRPVVLRPIYKVWMRIAYIIGWLNTRILLILIFYLVFMPIGLFARMIGRDFLDLKMDKRRESYWQKRPSKAPALTQYEKQF